MMFGFTPIVKLALFGVGTLVAGGAIYLFDQSRQDVGERRIEAKYQALSTLCDQFPAKTIFGGDKKIAPDECATELRKQLATGAAAVGANVSLQADVQRIVNERQACSDEVLRIQRQGARAAALSAGRKPADDARLAEIAPEKAALIAALGLPEPGGNCEARLARRDALWAKIAAQRARDFPPTSAAPASKDVTIKEPTK